MAVKYGFYDSLAGDRTYNALDMSRIFEGIITDGIFAAIGGAFFVTANVGTMNVTVAQGRAWFNHTWTLNDANLNLTVDASEVVLHRIDTVVIEVNRDVGTRANSIKILKGTPNSSPVPVTLQHTATLHQYALAEILVSAGVTQITQGNITNKVGTYDTPFLTGILESLDLATLLAQYEAQFADWFQNLQDELDANQASNLQDQIDDLIIKEDGKDSGWIPIPGTTSYTSVDGPTGVVGHNTDLTAVLQKGYRVKYTQNQPLTAYYNFDANSNAQVGGINGTDTAMSYSAGKFNSGAVFNGTTSKIVLADNTIFKPTGEFTVGCWVKTNVTGSQKGIFQSYSANTNSAGFFLRIGTGNTIELTIGKNTGTVPFSDLITFTGITNVCDNNHHYVVATFRNNFVQLYVDGVVEVSGYCFAPAYAATNYVRVGCLNASGTDIQFMNGQIDDLFLIKGYALDEETIRKKYILQTAQGSGDIAVTKMGIITAVGLLAGGSTPITIYGGNDYSLINASITGLHYSTVKVPYGFPIQPNKWSVLVTNSIDQTQASPVAATWYNLGSISITVPIGSWIFNYSVAVNGAVASAGTVQVQNTLSTANNSESNAALTSGIAVLNTTAVTLVNRMRSRTINLGVKTTFYINTRAQNNTYSSINNYNSATSQLVLLAECAYL